MLNQGNQPLEELRPDAILVGAGYGAKNAGASVSSLLFEEGIKPNTPSTRAISFLCDTTSANIGNYSGLFNILKQEISKTGVSDNVIGYVASKTDVLERSGIELKAQHITDDFYRIDEIASTQGYNLDPDTLMVLSFADESSRLERGGLRFSEQKYASLLSRFDESREVLNEAFEGKIDQEKLDFMSAYLTVERGSAIQPELVYKAGEGIAKEFGFTGEDADQLFSSTIYFLAGLKGKSIDQGLATLSRLNSDKRTARLDPASMCYIAARKDYATIESYVGERV